MYAAEIVRYAAVETKCAAAAAATTPSGAARKGVVRTRAAVSSQPVRSLLELQPVPLRDRARGDNGGGLVGWGIPRSLYFDYRRRTYEEPLRREQHGTPKRRGSMYSSPSVMSTDLATESPAEGVRLLQNRTSSKKFTCLP